jgi:hypothetical protein
MSYDFDKKIAIEKENNVSYICDKLTTTYNTNILDLASDSIKDQFLITSDTHRHGNEGKKVLMNLICNHFNQDSDKQRPMPRFIGGPINLTVHYSKEYNKMIYIFGEEHSDIVDCDIRFGDESSKEEWDKPNSKKMRVEYFLSEFIRTTDVFLDIFFEFPVVPKETGKYHDKYDNFPDGRLKNLRDTFKECLQRDTRTEVCSLARIHYFDTRLEDYEGSVKTSNQLTYFNLAVYNIFDNFFEDEQIKQLKIMIHDPGIKGLLDELAEKDEKKFKRIWFFFLTDISHNAKELDRLEKDPEMQHKILSFIRKKITKTAMKYKKKINDSVNIIFNNDKYTVSEFVDAFKLVNDILFSIGAHFADLYTLLRVFKTFNLSEMKQKAYSEATDQPDKAHNIIIYAGDAHSQTYRKFLEDVLHFDKIEVAGKEEPYGRAGELMYCIDMEPITQPLFSKYHELDSATDLIKPLVKAQQSESIL